MVPLFLLQAVSLRAYCSYCVATEALMLFLWLAGLRLGSSAEEGEPAADSAAVPQH